MAKLRAALLAAMTISAFVSAASADGKINEKGFDCYDAYDPCETLARGAADYIFSYAVINKSSYTLQHAILKAQLNGASSWTEVRIHKANMGYDEGVTFSFDQAWIADQLGTDVAKLQKKGFRVRGNIESTYTGPGTKQTNCPIVEVNYDGKWQYNKKGQNTTYRATNKRVFMWKPSGTAGDVSCKVESEE